MFCGRRTCRRRSTRSASRAATARAPRSTGAGAQHLTFGPTYRSGVSLTWVGIDDIRYLDPGLYDDVGTVEVQTFGGMSTQTGKWDQALQQLTRGRTDL